MKFLMYPVKPVGRLSVTSVLIVAAMYGPFHDWICPGVNSVVLSM